MQSRKRKPLQRFPPLNEVHMMIPFFVRCRCLTDTTFLWVRAGKLLHVIVWVSNSIELVFKFPVKIRRKNSLCCLSLSGLSATNQSNIFLFFSSNNFKNQKNTDGNQRQGHHNVSLHLSNDDVVFLKIRLTFREWPGPLESGLLQVNRSRHRLGGDI